MARSLLIPACDHQGWAVHNIPCHQVGVWKFNSGIGHLQLRIAILIDKHIALFILQGLHLTETLVQNSKLTLEAAYHYWEKGKNLAEYQQDSRIHHICDYSLMRKYEHNIQFLSQH